MRFTNIIFGVLIGILFILGGCYFLIETSIPTFKSWRSMQAWQPASATLIDVTNSINKTEASYRYQVNGFNYENDRVYVASFNDSIGSYHQGLQARLGQSLRSGRDIEIWYNPARPQESVIDRDMRWGLFILMSAFCAVFMLIGLTVCYSSLTLKEEADDKVALPTDSELHKEWESKLDDPAFKKSFIEYRQYRLHALGKEGDKSDLMRGPAPWLEKQEWRNDRIRSESKSDARDMWAFAIIWNLVTLTFYFADPDELSLSNPTAYIALVFPLIGIYLLYQAIRRTLEWKRFGVIEFVMDPFPGSIGGHVGGSLDLSGSSRASEYRVELECVYNYESGSDNSSNERIRWAQAGSAKVETSAGGTRLLFRFDIPDDLPESDIERSKDHYYWRLKVDAELPGINLERQYDIPVYRTSERSSDIEHDISSQVQDLQRLHGAEDQAAMQRGDFQSRSLRMRERGNELQLYFPMFRNKIATFFSLIFAAGTGAITYAIVNSFGGASFLGVVAIFVSLPFGAIALFTGVATIYQPFNNLRITIDRRKIVAFRRLLIFPIYYKTVRASEVTSLKVESAGSTGQGSGKVEHFRVIAYHSGGDKFTIAESIDGEELARQLQEFLLNRIKYGY